VGAHFLQLACQGGGPHPFPPSVTPLCIDASACPAPLNIEAGRFTTSDPSNGPGTRVKSNVWKHTNLEPSSIGVGPQSAAPGPSRKCRPLVGQWCEIYDVILLRQPRYDLLFFKTFLQLLSPNLS